MINSSSSSSILTQQFLPSISNLAPDPTAYQQQQQQQQQQHQHQQHQQQINHSYHFKNHQDHFHYQIHQQPNSNLNHPPYIPLVQQKPIHLIHRSLSSSTISGRPPPKTSRRQSKLNNLDRRRICEYAAAHPKSTQEDIALQWGIDRSSVSKILKYRDKWLSISPTARAAKVIKHRGGRFPQLESEVVRRCKQKSLSGGFLGDRTIKDLALDVSKEMGLGHGAFKASNGWLDAFKERAQIKGGRFLDINQSHSSNFNIVNHPDHHHISIPSTHLSPSQLISESNIDQQHQEIVNIGFENEDLEEDEDDDDDDDEEEEEEEDDDDDDDEEEEEEEEEEIHQHEQTQLKRPLNQNHLKLQDNIKTENNQDEQNDMQELPSDRFDQSIDSEPIQDEFIRSSTPPDPKHHYPTSASTPPLSSSNSSTSLEDGPHGVKMDSLKSSIDHIIAPIKNSSDLPTPVDHHDPSSRVQTDQHDAMDGIEQIQNDVESPDQTLVLKYSSPNPNTHHSNPYSRPCTTSSNDHRSQSFARRQASSNHSRSSSLSIGSLSQKSSVYGDDYHLNSPSMNVHPTHQLSSYSSHPNFHPPPLRTTPVRRTFPSLRHAMSQPAFNSQTNAHHHNLSHQPPPILPPMSATSSSPQARQYASFLSHPYSFSPLSAPPNHSSQPPTLSSSTSSRLPPVYPTRISHSHLNSQYHQPQRDDGIEWPTDEFGVGFDEALGALETVMRFLQDQPTSFATPRDYMVVGELFGRMKEKKQEMMSISVNNNTSNSGNNNNLNGLSRRLMTSSTSSNSSNNQSNTNINHQIRHHRSGSQQHQHSTSSNGTIVSNLATSPVNGLDLVKEDSQSDQMEH